MRGRDEEALFVLARLHAHGDINDSFVVAEHREILQQVALEKEETRDAWTLLFTSKSNFRRLLLGVALQFRYVLSFFAGNFDSPKNVFVKCPDDRRQCDPGMSDFSCTPHRTLIRLDTCLVLLSANLCLYRYRHLNHPRTSIWQLRHRTHWRSSLCLVHR